MQELNIPNKINCRQFRLFFDMRRKVSIPLLFVLCLTLSTNAQNDSIPVGSVIYTPAYKFKDGIYLSFQQLKINAPIPKTQILSETDYNSFDFFETLFKNSEITIYDELGVKQTIKTDIIWGFSDKGVLYVNLNDDFHRIPVFGSISHFIADKTYNDFDPYGYSPYSYNNRYNSYYYNDARTTKTVMVQYLLDFDTGKFFEFNVNSVELLISKDQDLFEEFSKLSGRKKNKLKFLYVRKFNQKHPVFFPIN